MARAWFITHPEVIVDPALPVPQWRLSARGVARMQAFASSQTVADVATIWSSEEVKARQAADILAAARRLPVARHAGLNENDRSATGFLPPAEFQAMADAFFASPQDSVRGWERAVDAQARVQAAFAAITAGNPAGDIAIVAHGGVGTLLYCALAALPISRQHDQPAQGHVWGYCLNSRRLLGGWQPIAPL